MPRFDIYFKIHEDDEYATYFTTIDAKTKEEAERISENMWNDEMRAISDENYALEAAYDAKGDEL